jgi:hypothetical protein
MEQIISKEEQERLKKVKGEIRGLSFKIAEKFLKKEEGEEGLEKIIKAMEEIGYSIDFKKIKASSYYPMSYMAAMFAITKKILNWGDKKFQEFGVFRVKSLLFVRLFMDYFVSLEKLIIDAPKMWKKISTSGDLELIEFNRKKRYVIGRLKNFYDWSYEQCPFFIGLFSTLFRMVLKKKVNCEETKCTFRGDEYHEFLIKW